MLVRSPGLRRRLDRCQSDRTTHPATSAARAPLGMTLTFPDQAPSRFGMALRTGTVHRLRQLEDARAEPVRAERRPAPLRKLSSWSPSWVITNV